VRPTAPRPRWFTVPRRVTSSDLEIEVAYGPASHGDLGAPGGFPFTRGPYPTMYRGRPWTILQYAGFGTARQTNQRFKALLAAGPTGISTAFDLPTQMGFDSDSPPAAGEVGKVGVAVDSLADMRALLDGLPLGEVTTSMTINATAPVLLLLYQLVAEEQGTSPERIRGPCRTTSRRSTSHGGPTSTRRRRPCGWSPTLSTTAAGTFLNGIRSR